MPRKATAESSKTSKSGWQSHLGLWVVCVVAVIFTHAPYLRLPYYWDEAGYYFPAALELSQHGHLIPQSTIVEVHPPLQSLYLAGVYKIFGSSAVVTRVAMCLVAGTAIYALLLLATLLVPAGAGLWSAGLLLVSPIFFAQSTLAHIDVAATAATLLALYFYLRGRLTGYLVAATVLCLTRETGAALVVLLAVMAWRMPAGDDSARHRLRQASMLLPLAPLALWFVYLRAATGHWFGDARFVAFNVIDAMNPVRIMVTLLRRLFFLFFSDFRWVLTIPAFWVLWKKGLPAPRPGHRLLWIVLALQLLIMSVFGGAILERYLLPALALFFLLGVEAIERLKLPQRRWTLLALTLMEMICWFWNPPYPFPYEENLAYADFLNLQETALERANTFPSGTRILTTWPATDEFLRPELGYVHKAQTVVAMPDFSEGSFDKIQPGDFDVIFMYAAEWHPNFDLLHQYPFLQRIRADLYHRHPPMDPIAVRLRFNLVSLGAIRLRGQWTEWMEHSDLFYRHPPPALQVPTPSPRAPVGHTGATKVAYVEGKSLK